MLPLSETDLKMVAEGIASPLGSIFACIMAIRHLAAENTKMKDEQMTMVKESIIKAQAVDEKLERISVQIENLSDAVSRNADAVEYCKAKNQILKDYETSHKG